MRTLGWVGVALVAVGLVIDLWSLTAVGVCLGVGAGIDEMLTKGDLQEWWQNRPW